jgi:TonB family protein
MIMARAFIWVTVCIICASTAVPAFANPDNANFDSEKYAEEAAKKFADDLEHAFKAAETKALEQEAKKISASQINASVCVPPSSILNAKDFEKAVICALSKTLPMSQGKPGSIVVSFSVSDAGNLQGLKMDQSSGDKQADIAALSAVRLAQLPAPPPGLTLADRTFRITYIIPNYAPN